MYSPGLNGIISKHHLFKQKLENLGHAGILFIKGSTGTTKYFEYGRYDSQNLGLVRRIPIPNASVNNGTIDLNSLNAVLAKISRIAGSNTRIEAALIEVPGKYEAMLEYALARKNQNSIATRKPYKIATYSCIHFTKLVLEAANVDTPVMLDPRPNSYIEELRSEYQDIDFSSGSLKLESGVY